jgi:putative DNA primase/helicase
MLNQFKQTLVNMRGLFADRSEYRPARCGNIKTLLLHLADMDAALSLWILRWLAFQLRNPNAKMTTALVINGRHPGKGLFFEDVLDQLFGLAARGIAAEQLHDRFTRWAVAPCSLVIVHGVFEPRHAARIRAFVTAESVVVERRGQKPQTRPNHLNFVFLSSAPDFLPESVGGRRFVIVETPPAWPRAFLDAVRDEIHHGGVHDFLEYLMRDLDMGNFNESTQPPAPALQGRKQPEAA